MRRRFFNLLPAICAASLLASLMAGLSGCFTEVGNPEDETPMTASFELDYTRDSSNVSLLDSVSIQQFSLLLKSATYEDTDSTQRNLWQNPSGYPVDFTGTDSGAALPAQTLKGKVLENLVMNFGFFAQKSVEVDTLNFGAFHGEGYIKGLYTLQGSDSSVEFLFALPDTTSNLTLNYSQNSLQGWLVNGAYHCQFSFLVFHWLSGVNLAQATVSTDTTGKKIALFDPEHNAALYTALTAGFYQAFNTAQVYPDTSSYSP
jgi:hypothetical protein